MGDSVSESSPFDSLPVDCISNIISFTSPLDACIVTSVSKTFESRPSQISYGKSFFRQSLNLWFIHRQFSCQTRNSIALSDTILF
ncbi:hypothetical protein ARALYDRAFT_904460 [Arabidopsis lyrata subsp. lyrata]|uniref:F-box domain-containing protein n=1 Tax=Arabidopsis lyrata subsp. lyrata TaxID=81972 RepID=D7LQ19_ARALL|nr:hypothetical protein ARALYDRAFT_904460 [Arabidopsis lyrata subsp. lyrata]